NVQNNRQQGKRTKRSNTRTLGTPSITNISHPHRVTTPASTTKARSSRQPFYGPASTTDPVGAADRPDQNPNPPLPMHDGHINQTNKMGEMDS
ncbi:unnamed protein product, partial [Lampetra planeri]